MNLDNNLKRALWKLDAHFYEYNDKFEDIVFNETDGNDFKRYTINSNFDALSRTHYYNNSYFRLSVECVYMDTKRKKITLHFSLEQINDNQEFLKENTGINFIFNDNYTFRLTKKNVFNYVREKLDEQFLNRIKYIN